MSQAQIPVVDLSAFTGGAEAASHSARRQTASELVSKLEVNGWLALRGHGVPVDRLQQAFNVSKRFFDLSYDEKMTAPHPEGAVPHRGYSGPGKEQGAASIGFEGKSSLEEHQASQVKDFKALFEYTNSWQESFEIQYNIWPPESVATGFREFTTAFYWELNKLALAILEALAMSLDLSEQETQELLGLHDGHDNQLRLLHYPAAEGKRLQESNTTRLGAHRDWTTFTLLFQDQTGGLEFFDQASETFVPAIPIDGVVYLNIADMFHRYSNGRYPSALHHVIPPKSAASDIVPERYSIPYFITPAPDKVIAPPPSVVAASYSSSPFEPTTYDAYTKLRWEAVRV